MTKEKKGCART